MVGRGRLHDQCALITGATSSIGTAVARLFARQGARIGLIDALQSQIDELAEELRENNNDVFAHAADVTQYGEVECAIAGLLHKLRKISVLVNNAGSALVTPFIETTEEIWSHVMASNVTSAFLMTQSVVPHMDQTGYGRIINISSEFGRRGAAWHVAESTAKSALIGLTQGLADEFGEDNIRVNAICPGIVKDERWSRQALALAPKYNVAPEEVEELLIGQIPLRRLATTTDVARTALFLASDESDYITGQAVLLSGGKVM